MPTSKQELAERGEKAVAKHVPCPRCNQARHLRRLPPNFECADAICKFCGYLAQVKATNVKGLDAPRPLKLPSSAWEPQRKQIMAGIYHDLFIVGVTPAKRITWIDRVPAHILAAAPEVFQPRTPLSPTAKRAGWQGFMLDLAKIATVGFERVYSSSASR
jgi:Dam-replacing family.